MKNRKKYTDENFKDKLLDYGYIYISGDYINSYSKLKCYDCEGYIVYVCFNKIENSNKKPIRFHHSNEEVEYNIRHFLEIHPEYLCTYVSGKYENSNSILNFKCKCGNIFSTTFDCVRSFHKNKCDKCSGYNNNLSYHEVKTNLLENGYCLLVDESEYKGITLTKLLCEDINGYKYIITYNAVMRGKKSYFVHKSNPYSIENINRYFELYSNNQFTCLSKVYKNKKELLKIRCNGCNRVFEQSWGNIFRKRCLDSITDNKTGARCPHCDCSQLESSHALVLKQVWLHEEKDTVVEDKSCINPLTNHILPTDIVNHRLKIAIEVQSWFHDFDDQKVKDKIKKDFWINNGYSFYAVDQRDYTILEMIQIFFPHITTIPDYIDFDYSNKIDDVKIQRLLNEGKTIIETAKIVNCKPHQIYDAMQYGRITYADGYIPSGYSPVVQLDLNGKYLNRYNSISEAGRVNGIKNGRIASCIRKKTYFSSGYYWLYESDYLSGNYEIKECRISKFLIPIIKYDKNGNFIKKYNTIVDASKETKSSCTDILKVINGERKSTYGYIYKLA